jgi:hypothetical protein
VIIRGGNYGEGPALAEGTARAEIEWAPSDTMTIDEEADLFKAQLRRYKKAVAMETPE